MSIEEKFFKTFGIEKSKLPSFCSDYVGHCIGCKYFRNGQRECYEYPQITDSILLELICILTNTFTGETGSNYNKLKSQILKDCINNIEKGQLKAQVHSLFKGGAE